MMREAKAESTSQLLKGILSINMNAVVGCLLGLVLVAFFLYKNTDSPKLAPLMKEILLGFESL